MIELFYAPTPNGRKISIMLEEAKINYKITEVNLNKDEQFKPDFLKVNSYGKIPAIIDHDRELTLIESGAILIYLARKSNQFLPKENETRRFIALIDECYERKVNLIISSEKKIKEIYSGSKLLKPIERALSRLEEMKSREFLSLPHLS